MTRSEEKIDYWLEFDKASNSQSHNNEKCVKKTVQRIDNLIMGVNLKKFRVSKCTLEFCEQCTCTQHVHNL